MIKNILFLLPFFLFPGIAVHGYAGIPDSTDQLAAGAGSDLDRVSQLTDYAGRMIEQGYFDIAEKAATQAFELSKTKNIAKGLAWANDDLGLVAQGRGDLTNAMNYFIEGSKIKEDAGD